MSPQTVHRPPLPNETTSTTTDHGVTALYIAYREVGAAERGTTSLHCCASHPQQWTTTARQLLWNS